MMDDNKQKALSAALSQIERQFGKGSVMRMGDAQAARDIEAISRLAEASARIRLSKIIERTDMERATRLFRHSRDESIGGDLTTMESGKKPTTRNREQSILQIIEKFALDGSTGFANLNDVFIEANRMNIDNSQVEEIIDKLVSAGRLYRPSGYETIGLA